MMQTGPDDLEIRVQNTQSWSYVARTMIAGGLSGVIAKTAIAPLDRVKILFQASNPSFERYAVVLSGATAVFFTYPLDLIRVRLAYEAKATPYMTLVSKIYHESAASQSRPGILHGLSTFQISNFYRGFLCTIVGMIPYAGASFLTHDIMQEFCRVYIPDWTVKPNQSRGLADHNGDYSRPELRTAAELVCGGIAGAVSMTAAYPFEVVRRNMQVAGALDPKVFVSMWDTVTRIYAAKGFRGFFVGLSIGYLKVTPMVACSFAAYEKMKVLLLVH
ncbi:hypothetical protein BGZ72_001077 [Mortierella alpina]|nr:hypothetical protein BGZ72_001077 [Mortierella alpina]